MPKRADLVNAAKDLNKVLDLNPKIDVTKSVSEITENLKEAMSLLTPDDKIAAKTQQVVDELAGGVKAESKEPVAALAADGSEDDEGDEQEEGEGEEEEEAEAAQPASPKRAGRKPRPPAIGAFNRVRRSGAFAKVLQAALAGSIPLAHAQEAAGLDRDKLVAVLKRARIANGIDHRIDEDGLTILLPEGVTAENVWHQPKTRTTPVGNGDGSSRKRKGMDEAEKGILPPPLDFSANTHKAWRGKLSELQALIDKRNLNGLKAWSVEPKSSSRQMLMRYRDCAIAALSVQQ